MLCGHILFVSRPDHGKEEEKGQALLMNRNEKIPKQMLPKSTRNYHSGFVPQNARWV